MYLLVFRVANSEQFYDSMKGTVLIAFGLSIIRKMISKCEEMHW